MSHEPQGSGLRLKIDFAQSSDPGRDPNKQVNEDSCGYAETRFGHLAVLCDGMGGHYGGREASNTAIKTIFEMFEQMPLSMVPAHALKSAIEEAGRRVYLLGGPPENRTRPGSTVVAMLLHDRGLDVAHVGDSRAYIIRSNQIYPLTRDHSMVQGMIDAGMLTEETAMGHPDSNKITRALGMKPEVDVELRPEVMELFAGDVLLQSSDGLTDLALGRDILGATRQALASGGVEHACTMLVKMANDRGGHDNITVQMVRVAEVGSKAVTTIPERPASHHPPPSRPAPTPDMQGPGAALPPQGPGAGWAPVLPTTPDMTPAAAALVAAAPPAAPSTGLQAGQSPGATPPPGLMSYRLDANPAALPLPPPSARLHAGNAGYTGNAGYGAPTATPLPGPVATPTAPTLGMAAVGGFTPAPGGFAPPGAMGGPQAHPMQPGRGGIVYVIIGLSAVIAVLILVIVWAVLLRN
jgi:PPM family protein phosphatase